MNDSPLLIVCVLGGGPTRWLLIKKGGLDHALKEQLDSPREVIGFDFVDWLRNQFGYIIGLRAHLYGQAATELSSGENISGITLARGGSIEVFFGDEKSYEAALSGDQLFVSNALYTDGKKYALVADCPDDWRKLPPSVVRQHE